ncbi:extracellular solute-binding protein [Nonomuraea soli]|uniref:Multiple sugar transport system substrate-binding protein n=1 Tax=Nonomuraea soli TaxID=1032476 RepID=A0A7W0CQR1_9ACTN|nr:extracellular solute-binding protein [Nonomuraea soli]MBA2895502.1 multiple sugar transport system substrate-binding protein [Nonomuraea soli]
MSNLLRLAAAALTALPLAACAAESEGPVALTWWQGPNAETPTQEAVAACTKDGKYAIKVETLPDGSDKQREQLVRRLSAKDKSVNLITMDVVWTAEFAEAGWILPLPDATAKTVTDGTLEGALKSATWKDKLYAAPLLSGSQLLWYRKSRAEQAGIDPAKGELTWEQLLAAAGGMPEGERGVATPGNRYEGYTVFVNALVASAGGQVVDAEGQPGLDSDAGRAAASVIGSLATGPAALKGMSTLDEETMRAAFEQGEASFMTNWGYVYAAAADRATKEPEFKKVFDDYGWARYPRVVAGVPSAPPLGGSNIAIGAGTPEDQRESAYAALACLTSTQSQKGFMMGAGIPAARSSVYDDAEVRAKFPFADVMRDSIAEASPRPMVRKYNALSTAIQTAFHPPASVTAETAAKAQAAVAQAVGQ